MFKKPTIVFSKHQNLSFPKKNSSPVSAKKNTSNWPAKKRILADLRHHVLGLANLHTGLAKVVTIGHKIVGKTFGKPAVFLLAF